MTAAPANTPGASNRLQRHTIVKRITHTHTKNTQESDPHGFSPPLLLHIIRERARGPLRIIRMEWTTVHMSGERAEDRKCVPINHAKCRGRLCIMFLYVCARNVCHSTADSLKKKSVLSSSCIVSPVVA